MLLVRQTSLDVLRRLVRGSKQRDTPVGTLKTMCGLGRMQMKDTYSKALDQILSQSVPAVYGLD